MGRVRASWARLEREREIDRERGWIGTHGLHRRSRRPHDPRRGNGRVWGRSCSPRSQSRPHYRPKPFCWRCAGQPCHRFCWLPMPCLRWTARGGHARLRFSRFQRGGGSSAAAGLLLLPLCVTPNTASICSHLRHGTRALVGHLRCTTSASFLVPGTVPQTSSGA